MHHDPDIGVTGFNRFHAGLTHADARLARVDTGLTRIRAGLTRIEADLTRIDSGLTRTQAGPTHIDAGFTHVDAGLTHIDPALARAQHLHQLPDDHPDRALVPFRGDRRVHARYSGRAPAAGRNRAVGAEQLAVAAHLPSPSAPRNGTPH